MPYCFKKNKDTLDDAVYSQTLNTKDNIVMAAVSFVMVLNLIIAFIGHHTHKCVNSNPFT